MKVAFKVLAAVVLTVSTVAASAQMPPPPGPRPPRPPAPPRYDARVCFHEHSHFRGNSFCLSTGETVRNLSGTGFNDKISSISIDGRARVTICTNKNLRGTCDVFYADVSSLADYGLNDQISSIEID